MATKILTAHDLADGDVFSAELTDVGDLVIDVEVTASSDTKKVEYTVLAKEGDNGYKPVRMGDEEMKPVQFQTYGNMGKRLKIAGIDSENVKIQVNTEPESTGLLTIEVLTTAKTATAPTLPD